MVMTVYSRTKFIASSPFQPVLQYPPGAFMIVEEFTWNEAYNIGVERIDNAHQEFFRIVRRLFMVTHSQKNNEWAAQEGIKFLKNYVLNHFLDEENYMRSIGYKFLKQHIAQHDVMRVNVVPKIEGQLIKHNYSPEAMDKFMRILVLWITRHILVHDKAIAWDKATPLGIDSIEES